MPSIQKKVKNTFGLGQISASNLSQRIDESSIKSELGTLALILNQMFGRLQASFERQARFAADASHELRTPTAVVLAQSELALARDRSPDEYQEALRACYQAAKRMESLVDGLLVLARIDAGQLEIRHEPVDMRQIVDNSVTLVKPLAASLVALRASRHCFLSVAMVLSHPAQIVNVSPMALASPRSNPSVTVPPMNESTLRIEPAAAPEVMEIWPLSKYPSALARSVISTPAVDAIEIVPGNW